ncbi:MULTISPECIES: zf-HC2 domain-containing protein [Streptomyces]|uniref:Zf-HC2 domain-containing protein n=1 Tax=Streptomyces lycii TaxID=2654337 RepID=A0ABQ7FBW4_9ACTN|nr:MULTISPECIES: hypothetical protein [Streptomyces]KAF4405478.1 zf-HC2 domain-containing protein [Streptomyces lycii]PGH48438.1 hypothetical protein CRI70_23185 [Streptomyces sp. Ru87]
MRVEHASARLVHDYARGGTGMAADELWALEAHLEACGICRERLAAAVATEAPEITALLGAVRSDLDSRLDAAAPAPKRLRRRARLPRWATPVMVPWLAMTAGLTLIALLLDFLNPDFGEVSPVLLLAPALPLAGVAAAWSPGLDPAHELTSSAPRAGLYLLLRRTASVLTVLVPVLFAGGRLTGVTVAEWLLPTLAFTVAALALGGAIGVGRAAVVLGAVWAAVILAPALATQRTPLALRPDQLPAWALLLALGAGIVIARRGAYSVLRNPR